MALSKQEEAAVLAIIARDGVDALADAIRAVAAKDRKTAASAALAGAISVTVSSWPTVSAQVAASASSTVPAVMADIAAAVQAKDQAALGPLLVQLYGGIKALYGS